MFSNKQVSLALIAAIILIALGINLYQNSGGYTTVPFEDQQILMDTFVTIKAYGEDKRQVELAVEKAMEAIRRVDTISNAYDPASELSKVNREASNREVPISDDLWAMVNLSLFYTERTGGAFDIAIRPVVLLWDFEKKVIPSKVSLDAATKLVNTKYIFLHPTLDGRQTILFSTDDVQLDLGGVAKGYAADKAVAELKKRGISSAIVTTGSTTILLGSKPASRWDDLKLRIYSVLGRPATPNRDFTLGIQHPRKKTGEVIGTVLLRKVKVSTSGDYQQYFIKNGQRYSHILNPKTGMSDSDLISVTVVTSRSDAEADILSTGLFVMGQEKAIDWLRKNPDVYAILINDKQEIRASKELRAKISDFPAGVKFF